MLLRLFVFASLAVLLSVPTQLPADEAQSHTIPDSSGRIYMINVNRWGYSRAMGFKVDGRMLKADRRRYSFIDLPTGLHAIEFGKDKVPLSIEAGQSYYFTLVEQGLGWGGFRLSRLSREEGEFYLKTLEPDEKQVEKVSHW